MKRRSFEDMNCSVAQALEIVGEWWTLLILRDAFAGIRRFDDFQSRLGISRNVLTTRLDDLVDNGILRRVPYSERPPRYEYRLTDKGRGLWTVLHALREWGDEWIVGHDKASVVLMHDGHECRTDLQCATCGDKLGIRDVQLVPGPGADGCSDLAPRIAAAAPASTSGHA
jgi:DNA-binding HxlR family transcriptional regulator